MKKRHQLVLLLAAVGLVLAGCGGSGSSTKDNNGGSAGKNAGTTLTAANFASVITSAQQKAKTSHVTMDVSAAGQKIKAAGDIAVGATAAESKVALKMDLAAMGAGEVEMRLVDSTFYINMGTLSQNKFATVDLADSSNPIASQYGSLVDQLDPAQQTEQLSKALSGMEKKGKPVKLDGVLAQPYELKLNTSKIAGMSSLGAAASANVPKEITYTMWVGPDDLPRRLVTDVAGSGVTMNYSRWGEPVDIQKPSKEQITSDDFLKQLGKSPAA